jgi:hypothetical protein
MPVEFDPNCIRVAGFVVLDDFGVSQIAIRNREHMIPDTVRKNPNRIVTTKRAIVEVRPRNRWAN